MRILITAGPTREPLDAVRFISNRSSGKMGLAIAQAAAEAGHSVTLLMGPGMDDIALPEGHRVYRFESSAHLKQLLEAHFRDNDVLIMAAAVSDYRPMTVAEGKLPSDKGKPLSITLEPTPDLVKLCAETKRTGQFVVAFALEEAAHLEERAAAKMRRKGVDAIVANPLGTMDADAVTAIWIAADGASESPGSMSKEDFARWLVERIGRGSD